jgi:dienelactone hydrolase
MKKPCRAFLLLAALCMASALPAAPARSGPPAAPKWSRKYEKAFEALVTEYAAAGDVTGKDRVLAKAGDLGPFPAGKRAALEKIVLAKARKGKRCDGSGVCVLGEEGFENGSYILTGAGNGKGIWLGLHGGGHNSGDGRTAANLWGSATGKGLIGVFPTTPRKTPRAWNNEFGERFLLAVLREVKRTYRVDTNRIYVGGHSMGGEGAWSIGGRFADRFAAATANAGGPDGVYEADRARYSLGGGVVANFCNVPIWFFHSIDDPRTNVLPDQEAARLMKSLSEKHKRHYVHVWKEYKDIGHGMPPKGVGPIINWVTSKKRNPWPDLVVWEPSRAWYRLFYWLRMKTPPYHSHGHGHRIVARHEGNRFEIEGGRSIRNISLLLHSKMIDARRPVVVLRNGRVRFEGYVQPDPRAVIETGWERLDPHAIATYRIDVPED